MVFSYVGQKDCIHWKLNSILKNQNISVNSDYAMGWTAGVGFLARAKKGTASLRRHIQTGSVAQPGSYRIGTGLFSGSKAAGM
jgi:hypothetical protein